jgi:CheY-like chemotaxis protein/tetratricopeptide (TPR) repeat protein
MARILAVDDDALARAVLVDALRGMHHEVVPVSGGREALERLGKGDIALVITDVMMPEMDGIELARRVGALAGAPPVLLASGVRGPDVTAEARAQGVAVAGFVPKPLESDALRSAISRAMAGTSVVTRAWSGEDALTGLAGPLEANPVHRILFLAHRVEATGTLTVRTGGLDTIVVLRGGRVVHVAGVPGLLAALPVILPDHRDLALDVGAAVHAGISVDDALRAAAEALGAFVASLLGEKGGEVAWSPSGVTPKGAIPLGIPIPRLLALGFRAKRAHTHVASFWATADRARLRPSLPDDAPESRWGLDMTALRVLRLAGRFGRVGELVAAAIGSDSDRRPDVLRALDLLHLLGLLELVPDERPAPAADAPPDRRADELRAHLARLDGLHPVEVLGLVDRATVSVPEVGAAWREAGRTVHPDRFADAPLEVRGAAEAVFDALRAANEALMAPGGLEDANAFLTARRTGVPYVTDRDRSAAKVSLRRGETLFRAREWKAADACFVEATRLDALAWPTPLYHAWCGWLARRIPTAEALRLLEALQPPRPKDRAEVLVAIGTILKLDGKLDEAMARFREAAEKDPENRDAQREIRLQERRAQPVAPPRPNLLGAAKAPAPRADASKADVREPKGPKGR